MYYDDVGRFVPSEPKFRFQQRGKWLITAMDVHLAPGVTQTFKSRVDLAKIERALRSGDISGLDITDEEIAGIFGDIWKGIKKVGKGIGKGVKKIGKAIGVKKIFKGLKKVAKLPGIAHIPYVGPALKAVDVGSDIATALVAKKNKRPKLAKKALRLAAKKAKKHKLDTREVARQGAKMYKLMISPS